MAKLTDLSDDVLYLVLQHLYPDRTYSLCILRRISTHFNVFAESVLYRDVFLIDDASHEQATYYLMRRLSDPNDNISHYVRTLQVKSFQGDDKSYCINTQLLLAALNGIHKLHFFSWECDLPIPDILLEVLHGRFPDLRLGVSIKSLDQPVLSSPRLQRLAVSIPHSDCVQWNWLKGTLTDSQNLRALTIDAHLAYPEKALLTSERKVIESGTRTDVMCNGSSAASSHGLTALDEPSTWRTQLPLKTEDRLPSLEELDIRTKTYDLDAQHCTLLLECMDWTKLRRLALGPSNPRVYFGVFKDQLPQLEALDFTYLYEYQPYNSRYIGTLTACTDFIASAPRLKDLTIRCDIIDFKATFWGALVQTHGDTLKSLSIQGRTPTSEAPVIKGDMNPFLACFESLETLDLVLQTHYPNSTGCKFCPSGSHGVSNTYLDTIPVILSLRSLRILLRVNHGQRSLYNTIGEHSRCAIRKIWTDYLNQFRVAGWDSQLESFSLTPWRWEPSSPHAGEDGRRRIAHASHIVFESKMVGERLMIRPRGFRSVEPSFYRKEWQETDESLHEVFVLDEPDPAKQGLPSRKNFLSACSRRIEKVLSPFSVLSS